MWPFSFAFALLYSCYIVAVLHVHIVAITVSLALPQRIVRYFVIAIALLLFCLLIGVASVVFVFAVIVVVFYYAT